MRFVWVLIVYSAVSLVIAYLLERNGQDDALMIFMGVFLVGQVVWWIALGSWLKKFGVGVFAYTKLLERVEGVPCPNCLYPICAVEDAPGVKLCPECGCSVDGVEAMKAWKRVPKLKVPQGWDKANF